ncbi:hypothetical protein ABEB36_007555 [Hypothenemus hampei]|uniref:SANT and BTB domain-containing protein n=1 Tax=Hypothenemus hampei TaxID=57062 RepID=A0ABD1EXH7_HYPHA
MIFEKMDTDGQTKSGKSLIAIQTKSKSDVAQITIGEFLNFLKTAYQVQESVEGLLVEGGMKDVVTWLKSKEVEFATNTKSLSVQTSDTLIPKKTLDKKLDILKPKDSGCSLSQNHSEVLTHKLNEVLSEGLLDSVLPFLLQNTNSLKKCPSLNVKPHSDKNSNNTTLVVANEKLARRKSCGDASSSSVINKVAVTKTASEVEIHVCDEVKNLKKTFICNQTLLVEKMGYFAEVTMGQNLEDMDISVHCDIGIFEWLMQWVKRDPKLEIEWPQLDSQCVIPILVSAAFLQMEPLLHDCLLYCHAHMNEILRTSTNLNCLNDSVLTRLAAMYTNTEIESIKDRKDKIHSRLFCKLIQSLVEPEPESVRGHWCSLARIFRCEKCQQLITPKVASKIPCIPSCMRLQADGTVISLHIRDPHWNINDYIGKLHKILKTWRKVYWRLWGDAHFLYCIVCKRYFPINQMGWCRYHPDTPQFFTLDAQKAPLPIGRYPCCGERAYRFQVLENYSSCQFRQHIVTVEDVRQSAIYNMLDNYRHLIEEEPPELLFPERLTRLVARDSSATSDKFVCKESFWWDGFEIIPPRPKLGFLTAFANRPRGNDSESVFSDDSTTEEITEEETVSSTSLESEDGSAESNPSPSKPVARKSKKRGEGKRLWQHNLSARSNQDIQRAYEEGVLKEIAALLNKKMLNGDISTKNTKANVKNHVAFGGLWTRLENEWRDSLNQREIQLKSKNQLTNKSSKPRSRF